MKKRYRIRNWRDYNKALVQRGSLNFWISEDVLEKWKTPLVSGKRGRPQLYSDPVILMALSIKNVFKLPLRATQGFLESLLRMLNLPLSTPNYTLLSKRAKTLEVPLLRLSKGETLDVVIDSTGLKIYGEGEWKVRTHGVSKRRTWRKIHLGVDPKSKEILASVITTNDVKDGEVLADILDQIPGALNMVALDGAYDERRCYETVLKRSGIPVIPPRKGARKGVIEPRNQAIQRIQETSLKEWKIEANYHKRSLAETTMFRYKTIFGSNLSSRTFETQSTEAFIRVLCLNLMTGLGMPDSYPLSA